jgi:hypothetical protein
VALVVIKRDRVFFVFSPTLGLNIVGRSMLRNTGLFRFSRDGADNRQWSHLPQHDRDEEESWHLNTLPEDEESE